MWSMEAKVIKRRRGREDVGWSQLLKRGALGAERADAAGGNRVAGVHTEDGMWEADRGGALGVLALAEAGGYKVTMYRHVPVGGPGHGTLRRTRKQTGRQSAALTGASSQNKAF